MKVLPAVERTNVKVIKSLVPIAVQCSRLPPSEFLVVTLQDSILTRRSRIAKDRTRFTTWGHNQGMTVAVYDDIPGDFKAEVSNLFDVRKRLPLGWVKKVSGPFCTPNNTDY